MATGACCTYRRLPKDTEGYTEGYRRPMSALVHFRTLVTLRRVRVRVRVGLELRLGLVRIRIRVRLGLDLGLELG